MQMSQLKVKLKFVGTSIVLTGVLLASYMAPSIAAACEGEEAEKNISVSAKLVKFLKVIEGKTLVTYTNNNTKQNWAPKSHTVKQIQKTAAVWTIGDMCSGKVIAPNGGTCDVEITFKANGEAGRFISELEMEGAPATANVKMEGEE